MPRVTPQAEASATVLTALIAPISSDETLNLRSGSN